MKKTELLEGTKLNVCRNCVTEFVVFEDFADTTFYCSTTCQEAHSLFALDVEELPEQKKAEE